MTSVRALGAWLTPALLAPLALRVATGHPEAAWLLPAALVAPLVALLRSPARARRDALMDTAAGVAVALLVAANVAVVADAARLVGATRWHGVVAAVLLLAPAGLSALVRARAAPLLALAVGGLGAATLTVAIVHGAPPWTAWAELATRSAVRFPSGSPWVVGGQRMARTTTFTVVEGQRVTVLSENVYRVVESDTVPATVREWRLGPGETLALRPGDALTIPAGARVRFDAGRRVPGAPASGVVWADASGDRAALVPAATGALVTLVLAALALVPGARGGRGAGAGPVMLLVAVLSVAAWGIYVAADAPDLTLGESPAAPLLALGMVVAGRGGLALGAGVALALALALAAGARALRDAAALPAAGWLAVTAVGAVLALVEPDAWRLLAWGLGLVATARAPALLAPPRTAAAATLDRLAGATGLGVFAAVGLAGLVAPAAAGALGAWPAVVAAPLAAGLAALARPAGRVAARAVGKALRG
jgi:hypothetical protein